MYETKMNHIGVNQINPTYAFSSLNYKPLKIYKKGWKLVRLKISGKG
jgi:hypothetical protein